MLLLLLAVVVLLLLLLVATDEKEEKEEERRGTAIRVPAAAAAAIVRPTVVAAASARPTGRTTAAAHAGDPPHLAAGASCRAKRGNRGPTARHIFFLQKKNGENEMHRSTRAKKAPNQKETTKPFFSIPFLLVLSECRGARTIYASQTLEETR